MNGSTTDVIVARSHDVDRLSTMVVWSVAAHVVVTAIVVLMPHPTTDLAARRSKRTEDLSHTDLEYLYTQSSMLYMAGLNRLSPPRFPAC